MKTSILLAAVAWISSGCITLKDHGNGTYSVGLDKGSTKTEEKAPERKPVARKAPEQHAAEKTRVVAESDGPKVETTRVEAHAPVAPLRIDADDKQSFTKVAFADVTLTLHACVTDPDLRVYLKVEVKGRGGVDETFEVHPDSDSKFMTCDETGVEASVVKPGLLSLGVRCYVEGGDNNYETWWVGLARYAGTPTSRADFDVVWSGLGSSSAMGEYADTTVDVKFDVRADGIYRVEETSDGCEAGANSTEDGDEEPCVPSKSRVETLVAPLEADTPTQTSVHRVLQNASKEPPLKPIRDVDDAEYTHARMVFPAVTLDVQTGTSPGEHGQTNTDLYVVFTTNGGSANAVQVPTQPDHSFSGCDETGVRAAELSPGLLKLEWRCFAEGGDNNYETWWVALVRYEGAPKDRQDFEVVWSGEGDGFESGYYSDMHVTASFESREDGIYRIQETLDGCEAGVRDDPDDFRGQEPCTPTVERVETKIASP